MIPASDSSHKSRLHAAKFRRPQNLSLLKSGKVKGVRFATLDRICHALDCQPGDLLAWEADDGETPST